MKYGCQSSPYPSTPPRKLRKTSEDVTGCFLNTPSGKHPLREINNGLTSKKDFTLLKKTGNGSPYIIQTKTPRKRKLKRSPCELYVAVNGFTTDEIDIRFLVNQSICNNTYCNKRDVDPPNEQRKKRILVKQRLVSSPIKQPVSTEVDLQRRLKYKGKRKRHPSQYQVMGYVTANEYVATVEPTLERKTNWEWLHRIAFCIGGPKNTGPQDPENLVAGTYECNRLMLAFERNIKKVIDNKSFTVLKVTTHAELRPCSTCPSLYTLIANKIIYTIQDNYGNIIKTNFYGTVYHGYPKELDRYAQDLVAEILKIFSNRQSPVRRTLTYT